MTRKELELALVRVAEKYPDRVANWEGIWDSGRNEPHCILGTIAAEFGAKSRAEAHNMIYVTWFRSALGCFINDIMEWNDHGTPWGQIPVRLGLVPGEQPAEPVTQPEEVELAEPVGAR